MLDWPKTACNPVPEVYVKNRADEVPRIPDASAVFEVFVVADMHTFINNSCRVWCDMSGTRPNIAEEIRKNKEICARILALHPKIRYVGMINAFGKTIAAELRKGLRPLFKTEEARDEFFLTGMRESLRKSFVPSLGRNHFTLSVHEKVRIVSFSNDRTTFYVTLEKDMPYDEIAKIVEQAMAGLK